MTQGGIGAGHRVFDVMSRRRLGRLDREVVDVTLARHVRAFWTIAYGTTACGTATGGATRFGIGSEVVGGEVVGDRGLVGRRRGRLLRIHDGAVARIVRVGGHGRPLEAVDIIGLHSPLPAQYARYANELPQVVLPGGRQQRAGRHDITPGNPRTSISSAASSCSCRCRA